MGTLVTGFGCPGIWRRPAVVSAWSAAVMLLVAGIPSPTYGSPQQVDPGVAATPVTDAVGAAAGDEAPLTAPDAVTAMTIARLEGKPVEVLGQRTMTGSVFALPDGTLAAGMASGPVWVPTGSGDGTAPEDWAALDLTLHANQDGSITPAAHPGALVLSGATPAGTAPDAEVVVAQMTTAEGEVSSISWLGPLPTPRLEGARAVYAGVRPGVDMVVDATASGFEQFFVVHEAPGDGEQLSLPVVLNAVGATLSPGMDESLEVLAPDGDVVARAPEPMMWDAAADIDRAHPVTQVWAPLDVQPRRTPPAEVLQTPPAGVGEQELRDTPKPRPDAATLNAQAPLEGRSAPLMLDQDRVERTVEQTGPGRVLMTLTPGAEILADATTVYPVVVDPEMTIDGGFDTYVHSGAAMDFSTSAELMVGSFNGGASVHRSFIWAEG